MVALDAVVLPAFRSEEWPADETVRWLDRYDLDREVPIAPGSDDYHTPLYHDGTVGVLATGMGDTAAAIAAATLLAGPVDVSGALLLTAGIAGGPPARTTVGTTTVGDAVVDWDRKHRTDDGDGSSVSLLEHRPRDYVHRLNGALVERALAAVEGVDLVDPTPELDPGPRETHADDDPPAAPTVERGTVIAGGEFWHGRDRAAEAEWLCREYGAGPHLATNVEDAGTAHALARHGALSRYLTVRSVSNFDRPPADDPDAESHDWAAGLEPAAENAFRVADAVLSAFRADPDGWRATF